MADTPSMNPFDYLAAGLQGALMGVADKAGAKLHEAGEELDKAMTPPPAPAPPEQHIMSKLKHRAYLFKGRDLKARDVLPYAAVGLGAVAVVISAFKR